MTTILIHVDLCHSVALALHEQRVISSESILCGWQDFFKAFRRQMYKRYNMFLDEGIEHKLQRAFADFSDSPECSSSFAGLDIVTGQKVSIPLTGQELYQIVTISLERLTDFVRMAVEETPPQYAGEILDSGIALSCENTPFLAVFAYHLKSEMGSYGNMEIHLV